MWILRKLRADGFRVHVLEWLDAVDDRRGLADYADHLIAECVAAVTAASGRTQLFLLGHSLGGTLAAIFATLLDRYGLRARRTVFIDDSNRNIDAAADLGLIAVAFSTPGKLRADLHALGLAIAADPAARQV